MPIVASELIFYAAANIPEDDVSLGGGAIDTTARFDITQWTANAVAAVVSSAADTRTVTITGRLATGAIATETLTLNGTTEVAGVQVWERVLKIVASATHATNVITVRQGAGGLTRATIAATEIKRAISFQRSASATGAVTRWEKQFAKNTNVSITLTSAQVTLTADSTGKIQIGLAAAVNDTNTITNRVTAPAGITFSGVGVALNVPGTQLASGQAIGVWVQEALLANDSAQRAAYTLQLSGQTV